MSGLDGYMPSRCPSCGSRLDSAWPGESARLALDGSVRSSARPRWRGRWRWANRSAGRSLDDSGRHGAIRGAYAAQVLQATSAAVVRPREIAEAAFAPEVLPAAFAALPEEQAAVSVQPRVFVHMRPLHAAFLICSLARAVTATASADQTWFDTPYSGPGLALEPMATALPPSPP
jgi:hypothetical protein